MKVPLFINDKMKYVNIKKLKTSFIERLILHIKYGVYPEFKGYEVFKFTLLNRNSTIKISSSIIEFESALKIERCGRW
jgi:hypothetical protein